MACGPGPEACGGLGKGSGTMWLSPVGTDAGVAQVRGTSFRAKVVRATGPEDRKSRAVGVPPPCDGAALEVGSETPSAMEEPGLARPWGSRSRSPAAPQSLPGLVTQHRGAPRLVSSNTVATQRDSQVSVGQLSRGRGGR